jgi:hypothetical protein
VCANLVLKIQKKRNYRVPVAVLLIVLIMVANVSKREDRGALHWKHLALIISINLSQMLSLKF